MALFNPTGMVQGGKEGERGIFNEDRVERFYLILDSFRISLGELLIINILKYYVSFEEWLSNFNIFQDNFLAPPVPLPSLKELS